MTKKSKLNQVDLAARYRGDDYDGELLQLQYDLLAVQLARFRAGFRTIVLFEGWDAAGKGGCIKRLVHHLDPRMCRVWPIAAPTAPEKDHHYLYRFWRRLPEKGCMAIFDRSWYGRVLIERVEELASAAEWRRAYREINEFERLLADDGVLIMKFFLHISPEEQADRFVKRFNDPIKRWKLTEEDFHNRSLRGHYLQAIEEMIGQTDTAEAPWRLIPAEAKKYARIAVMKQCIEAMGKGVDLSPPVASEAVAEQVQKLTLD